MLIAQGVPWTLAHAVRFSPVLNRQPQKGHLADHLTDGLLQFHFRRSDVLAGRTPLAPCREFVTVPLDQRRSDDEPECRVTIIAAAAAPQLPPVRRQATPQFCATARSQSVSADPHKARACTCVGTALARFTEEIDSAHWPRHAAAAVGERPRYAYLCLKRVQNRIKEDKPGRIRSAGTTPSPSSRA